MRFLPGLFFVLWTTATPAVAQAPSRIDVFTDSAHPVANVAEVERELGAGVPVRYFELDAQLRLEEALSEGLPADPDKARALALRRIRALARERIGPELSRAVEGAIQAREYGIDRYPAVVFDDGDGAVYGVTDLAAALRRYRAWRR